MKFILLILISCWTVQAAVSLRPGQLPRIVTTTDEDAQPLVLQDGGLKLYPGKGYGMSLLTLQNDSLARDYLGLTIGTDILGYDADLAVIGTLDTTSYGRSILTINGASTARTYFDAEQKNANLTAIAALDTATYGRGFLTNGNASIARGYLGLIINTDVQGYSVDLQAIGALSTASYGRQILTNGTASSARTYLGVAIGSNVQAWDADLDSLAALTSTSFGRGIITIADATAGRSYINAQASSAELSAIAALSTTSYGRSFLTVANAPAARTYTGTVIGTDVQAYSATLQRLSGTHNDLVDAATIATDASVGNNFRVTLSANRTLGNPTNPTDGQTITWEILQDGTGTRTLAADTAFAFGTEITSFAISTTASKRSFIKAIYNSTAAKWYVIDLKTGY